MRIAIIGQQAFGKAVLDAFLDRGDDVAGVFCAPEKPGAAADPLRVAAQERGLTVFQFASLKTPEAAEALATLDVDLGIMAYVLQFAPQEFVTIPRHGMIQYHPSLLPKYRGPSSINWPLINGETETGLTIFRPSDGLDEGAVILQKRVAVGPNDTVGTVYFNSLFPQGVAAMLEAADLTVAGRQEEVSQDEARASYEGWCRDPEARVNWRAPAAAVHNLIRGCDPAPGAWTLVGGQKARLFGSKLYVIRRFADVVGKPGDIAAIGPGSIRVTVQGGTIEIAKVKADGGKITAEQFAIEMGLQVGKPLESEAVAAPAPRSLETTR